MKFPKCNRRDFYRDLNARIAEIMRNSQPDFPGGHLFERRYSEQALGEDADAIEQFAYCAPQPVQSGLSERVSDYPGYNSMHDAICGIEQKYKILDKAKYKAARKRNPCVCRDNYTTEVTLKYDRLPGHEDTPRKEYEKILREFIEKKRVEIVRTLKESGHTFLTEKELRKVKPGTLAKNPKKSSRNSFRPLVLSRSPIAKKNYLEWYFTIYKQYKEAVKKYLAGDFTVEFPPGTYRPPGLMSPYQT